MKHRATFGARIILGLIFFVFGLNGLVGALFNYYFLPMPPPPEELIQFFSAFWYFVPFLKIVEVTCGALLLANLYVPLALVLLAPIAINIFLYHLLIDPGGVALPIFIIILMIWLAYGYWGHFKGLLSKTSRPTI